MADLAPSGIRDISNAAGLLPDAIRLDLGQPDFPTPPHIAQAAKAAIDRGQTQYTHTQGTSSLRAAICEKLGRVNSLDTTPASIACSGGGVGAVAAAMASVLSAGDEVLVPDPAWSNFRMICAWLQAVPVPYPCRQADRFEPAVDALSRLVTPRTRLLIVNSPNNPTGAVYSRDTLEAMRRLAEDHGLWLLSDECYDEIVFQDVAGLTALASDYPGLISIFSCPRHTR